MILLREEERLTRKVKEATEAPKTPVTGVRGSDDCTTMYSLVPKAQFVPHKTIQASSCCCLPHAFFFLSAEKLNRENCVIPAVGWGRHVCRNPDPIRSFHCEHKGWRGEDLLMCFTSSSVSSLLEIVVNSAKWHRPSVLLRFLTVTHNYNPLLLLRSA